MESSLANAYLRVERAGEHLEQAKLLHNEIIAAQREATIVEFNPNITINPGELTNVFMVESGQTAIPERLRILIGETAYNLRVALDYLVAQLSLLDTPNPAKKRRTQFPIEVAPEGFKGQRKTFLAGVNDAHAAAIEQLQPYNGCDWIDPLRRLSNFEKHDDLVIVAHDYMMGMKMSIDPAEGDTRDFQMQVQLQPVLRVTLADGLPVIETLEIIKLKVSETLDAFKPEF